MPQTPPPQPKPVVVLEAHGEAPASIAIIRQPAHQGVYDVDQEHVETTIRNTAFRVVTTAFGPLVLEIAEETTTIEHADWVKGKTRIRAQAPDGAGRKFEIDDAEADAYALGERTATTTSHRIAGSASYLLDSSREWSLEDGSLLAPYTQSTEVKGLGWVGYLDARCAVRDQVSLESTSLDLMALVTLVPESGVAQRFAIAFDAAAHDAHVARSHRDDPDPDGTDQCSPATISGDAQQLVLDFGEGESLTIPVAGAKGLDAAKARFVAPERRQLVALPRAWGEILRQ